MRQALVFEVSLFQGLSEPEQEAVARTVTIEEHPAGARLFSCGDAPTCFYVIESGRVEIRIPQSAVQPERHVVLGPGEFFGEMGALRGRPRMADAAVLEDAALLRVDQNHLDLLLEASPSIAAKLTRALRQRVDEFRSSEEATARSIRDPHTLLFVSPGGHGGASTVVAGLAPRIRSLAAGKVLVLDACLEAPRQSMLLGQPAGSPGLTPALAEGGTLEEAVVRLSERLELMAPANEDETALAPEALAGLLPRAADRYEYVLADVGPAPAERLLALAREADATQLVFQATAPEVAGAKALLAQLRGEGLDGRVRLVVHQLAADAEMDLEAVEFELGQEVVGRVAPDAPGGGGLAHLARSLLCLPTGETEALRSFSLWGWLTSRAGASGPAV